MNGADRIEFYLESVTPSRQSRHTALTRGFAIRICPMCQVYIQSSYYEILRLHRWSKWQFMRLKVCNAKFNVICPQQAILAPALFSLPNCPDGPTSFKLWNSIYDSRRHYRGDLDRLYWRQSQVRHGGVVSMVKLIFQHMHLPFLQEIFIPPHGFKIWWWVAADFCFFDMVQIV